MYEIINLCLICVKKQAKKEEKKCVNTAGAEHQVIKRFKIQD
jgi:hypothetical protein